MSAPILLVAADGHGEFTGIQQAIVHAGPGSQIEVEPGEYVGRVHLDRAIHLVARGPGVIIRSQQGAALTIAAPEGSVTGVALQSTDSTYSAVRAAHGTLRLTDCSVWSANSPAVQVSGGTLIAERSAFSTDRGGGSWSEPRHGLQVGGGASLVLSQCVVGPCSGSGIVVDDGIIDITGTRVSSCAGNALWLIGAVTGTVSECDLSDCDQTLVWVGNRTRVEFRTCIFHDSPNGGLYSDSTTPQVLIDCEFRALGGPASALAEKPSENLPAADVAALLSELDSLVGLAAVKRDVQDTIAFIELERRQMAAGLVAEPMSRHLVFSGPPGTGKTTVARLYAKLLTAIGMLPQGTLIEVDRSKLVGEHIGETAQLVTRQFEEANGGVLFIDEAYSLVQDAGSATDFGVEAINTLVKLMEDHRTDVVVIVAGYTAKMEQFLAANPGLASRFTQTIHFDAYTVDELVEIFRRRLADLGLKYDEEVTNTVRTVFSHTDRGPSFGNAREARQLIDQARVAMARRLAGRQDLSRDELVTLTSEDLRDRDEDRIATPSAAAVVSLRADLDAMIGLKAVKDQVADLIDVLELQERQRQLGLETHKISFNLVFAGSPGTGKTTVARLYGRILAAMGLLRDGHVVESSKTDLVAGFVGQTGAKTTGRFAEARGGILFIDEAYALAPRGRASEDFGVEAIDTLVKLMEDHRSDVVVIVAGYTDNMREFLEANPGLESRFDTTIVFADYSDSELLEIFRGLAQAEGKQIDPAAEPVLLERFATARRSPNFGNGRYARKLLQEATFAMARRLHDPQAPLSRSELTTITADDVRGR